MLVCGKKDVYKYLSRGKVEEIYISNNFSDKNILKLLDEINKNEEIVTIKYSDDKDLDGMVDKVHEGIIAKVRNRFIFILLFIISIVFLIFTTTGIAFSLFDIVDKNIPSKEIKTGEILFNYSDVNGVGNGIKISNAYAIKDSEGINLRGKNEYFDFVVSGKTYNIPLTYYILLEKQNEANLNEKYVKIYLTKLNGVEEEKIDVPHLISDLDIIEFEDNSNRILYKKSYDDSFDQFSDNYRVRIWIDENASNYYNKTYSMKINVYGEGR